MQSEYLNLYQRARKATFYTQEQAAELLAVSVESLKAYEAGKRVPPDDVVARMVEAYDLPWLALEHSHATDALGVLPEVQPKSLTMASISITNRLNDATARISGLLRIAEDGVIDESERPEFDEIVHELRETIAAAYAVIYAAEAKKERPEAGTSKRSGFDRGIAAEHEHMSIVPHSAKNARGNFAKGAWA